MAKSPSEAERFRVERAGPFIFHHDETRGWLIHNKTTAGADDFGWLHREGFFIDTTENSYEASAAWKRVVNGCYFPTEAEAQFLLLLATDPRKALQPFLEHDSRGGIISYEGTCGGCDGLGYATAAPFSGTHYAAAVAYDIPCFTCHGTGGPPAQFLLEMAADWFGERGEDMQAEVLMGLIQKPA